ncbi:MAG: PH domain-containing protein [Cyanobacteria bacterium P01_A01_bin.135]
MFKNIASDALGLSDVGAVIAPADYDKVDSDNYILHEENEKIYFLIKSKSDEYCFTNLALIHLDGTSATSRRRLLKRFSYRRHTIQGVRLETAGTLDMDIEIKFAMGGTEYSIDVNKSHLTALKDLYKTLVRIASIQHENSLLLQHAQSSLSTAATASSRFSSSETPEEQFKAINQYTFNWLKYAQENFMREDFGGVFEKFINN